MIHTLLLQRNNIPAIIRATSRSTVAVGFVDLYSSPYRSQGIDVAGHRADSEPLKVTVPSSLAKASTDGLTSLAVTVVFQGHYNEPEVTLECPIGQTRVFDLDYDVMSQGGWSFTSRTQ